MTGRAAGQEGWFRLSLAQALVGGWGGMVIIWIASALLRVQYPGNVPEASKKTSSAELLKKTNNGLTVFF